MNLYRHSEELAALMRLFDDATDSETGEINAQDSETLESWAASIEAGFDAKLEAVECYRRNIQAEAAALKAEEQRMAKRRKALENRDESLSAYILSALAVAGKDKATAGTFSFSVRSSESVAVDPARSLDDLPLAFVRIEERKTLDRAAIKAAIKAGDTFPGLWIERKRNLVVR